MQDDYYTVFKTFDLSILAVAKSLLNDAQIDYVVQNENFGSLYSGFFTLTGYIEIQVREADAALAEEILSELKKEHKE
jgi:hypothetical protein